MISFMVTPKKKHTRIYNIISYSSSRALVLSHLLSFMGQGASPFLSEIIWLVACYHLNCRQQSVHPSNVYWNILDLIICFSEHPRFINSSNLSTNKWTVAHNEFQYRWRSCIRMPTWRWCKFTQLDSRKLWISCSRLFFDHTSMKYIFTVLLIATNEKNGYNNWVNRRTDDKIDKLATVFHGELFPPFLQFQFCSSETGVTK